MSVGTGPDAVSGDPSLYMRVSVTSDIFLGGIKPDSRAAQFIQDNGIFMPEEGSGSSLCTLVVDSQVQSVEITSFWVYICTHSQLRGVHVLTSQTLE